MPAPLPPAVVLGIDTPIGLAIVRDLGAHGVAVHGIARQAGALGLASRYLRQGHLRADGEAALIGQLRELARGLGHACLYAISEADIALLNRHRDGLRCYTMMFADAERMARVLDKEQTYRAAQAAGICVPRTVQAGSAAEAAAACAALRYPLVLKWADPNRAAPVLAAAGLKLDKTRYCHCASELLAYLQPYEAVGQFPLIQEYCPGYGLGQFILMRGGQAHFQFQHRRIHEWPPEGGVSSVCEALAPEAHRALMAQSLALLRALEWEGIAMVEYRYDPHSGVAALMEVNGRFWGSLPLACQAGAPFPWLYYQLFVMGKEVRQTPYQAGARCRFMIPESKRLLRVLFGQRRIADKSLTLRRLPALRAYLGGFFRPRSGYYVFAWRDPLPFLRDMLNMLRRR